MAFFKKIFKGKGEGIIPPPPAEGTKLLVRPSKKGEKGKEAKKPAAKAEEKPLPENAEELNKKGMELAAKGKTLVEVRRLFEKAHTLAPDWTWPLYNIGELLRNNKAFNSAIVYYNKVLEINPRDAGALNGKGMCLIELRQVSEALGLFEKAIEISPEWTWPRYNIGDHYLNVGRYQESVKWFDNVLIINPKDEWALLGKGISILGMFSPLDLAEKKEAAKEALPLFKKALQLNPKLAEARFYRGIALIRILGKKEEALAAFKRGAEALTKAGRLKPIDTSVAFLSAAELRLAQDYENTLNEIKAIEDEEFMMRHLGGKTGGEIEPSDTGVPRVQCPRCMEVMEPTSPQRPLEIRCSRCNSRLTVTENNEVQVDERIARIRCPKCQEIMDVTSPKRPLEVRCVRCNAKLMLRT